MSAPAAIVEHMRRRSPPTSPPPPSGGGGWGRLSAPAAIVEHMRRRSPAKSSQPQLSVMDAGCCLIGLEHMRRLGLPCPSGAAVLRSPGIDADAPDAVEDASLLFKHK